MGNCQPSVTKEVPYAEAVAQSNEEGHSQVWRSIHAKEKLVETPAEGIHTLYDLFERAVKMNPNGEFLGTRERLADGTAGAYHWKTYSQVKNIATNFGSGLVHMQMVKEESFEDETYQGTWKFLGTYSKNREELYIAEQAANAYNFCLVPLYDTLGPDTVEYITNQTRMSVITTAGDGLKSLLQVVSTGKTPTLKFVVCFDAPAATEELKQQFKDAGVTLTTWDEVCATGISHPQPHTLPKPADCQTLCYTSGTTGQPKGAMITQKMFITDLAGVVRIGAEYGMKFVFSDAHISYLPFAHIFERLVFQFMMFYGCKIGMYQGDTQKIVEDVKELKPTIFVSVPRLLNRVHDKIKANAAEGSGMKSYLFNTALETKLAKLRQTGDPTHAMWDSVVFSKVKQALGGKVRYMVTGSAPISANVHEFLKVAFSVPVFEGYGMTEACAAAFITSSIDPQCGHVGGPFPNIEFKVVSVPDMGYLVEDRDELDRPCPRGELWIRGDSVFPGYFRNKEQTEAALTKDGWLRTGDVVQLRPNGTIRIVDRAKAMFKLAQGEYAAPEKIENVYIQSAAAQQVFCYGDSYKAHLVGIVVPKDEFVSAYAAKTGKENDVKKLVEDKEFVAEVKKSMDQQAKVGGLKGFEKIKSIRVIAEPFTVENDLLTPTFKLKRHVAKKAFLKAIDEMYAEDEKAATKV
eukprot:GDKI01047601.1.p1 GENE.GDKI01047601.1~~GDKI01047601.1.p1  ORF type:complete len:689 (-),score=256.97 GDKI01047601.1:143-2209(-)